MCSVHSIDRLRSFFRWRERPDQCETKPCAMHVRSNRKTQWWNGIDHQIIRKDFVHRARFALNWNYHVETIAFRNTQRENLHSILLFLMRFRLLQFFSLFYFVWWGQKIVCQSRLNATENRQFLMKQNGHNNYCGDDATKRKSNFHAETKYESFGQEHKNRRLELAGCMLLLVAGFNPKVRFNEILN